MHTLGNDVYYYSEDVSMRLYNIKKRPSPQFSNMADQYENIVPDYITSVR